MLSLIIPCYNEEKSLPVLYQEVNLVLQKLKCKYEIILVDDGSRDDTLGVIQRLSAQDPHILFFSFSRNFGKEAAMYAGLCNAHGDYIAIMDADMQDPPALLSDMMRILEEGQYDCVAARRIDRKGEPLARSFFAKLFYKVINRISDVEIVDGARDFRLMTRQVADALISMGEYNRFSKGLFGWVGFRTYWLSYENVERKAGATKWNIGKLFRYAVDGIISFSQVPLRLASWFGLIMTAVSVLFLFIIVGRKLIFGDPVAGWASMVCIVIFIGGIQLFCMGVIGQYIAKIYMETKKRPHYIIAKTNAKLFAAEGIREKHE